MQVTRKCWARLLQLICNSLNTHHFSVSIDILWSRDDWAVGDLFGSSFEYVVLVNNEFCGISNVRLWVRSADKLIIISIGKCAVLSCRGLVFGREKLFFISFVIPNIHWFTTGQPYLCENSPSENEEYKNRQINQESWSRCVVSVTRCFYRQTPANYYVRVCTIYINLLINPMPNHNQSFIEQSL